MAGVIRCLALDLVTEAFESIEEHGDLARNRDSILCGTQPLELTGEVRVVLDLSHNNSIARTPYGVYAMSPTRNKEAGQSRPSGRLRLCPAVDADRPVNLIANLRDRWRGVEALLIPPALDRMISGDYRPFLAEHDV